MPDTKPSRGLQAILDRLNRGHSVPMDVINQASEIKLAESRSKRPPTDPWDYSRADIQQNACDAVLSLGSYTGEDNNGKPVYAGIVKAGHEYHLMFGLPASGKSTIADKLSQAAQARIMDSDYVKEQIPEFDGGWGAAAVHKESKRIMDLAMAGVTKTGANIIVPRIGTPPDEMIDLLKQARADGYKCYAHYVDLSPEKAMGRLIGRYLHTGRYIPPAIAASKSGENGENLVYESFKQVVDSGICDGWTYWSNDVAKGQPPVLLGYGKNPDQSILNLIKGADGDTSRIIGTTPETEDIKDSEIGHIRQEIDRDTDEAKALAASHEKELAAAGAQADTVKSKGILTARMSALLSRVDRNDAENHDNEHEDGHDGDTMSY